MRGQGLLLILLIIGAMAAYSQLAAAGGKSVETTVVPNSPVAVHCRVNAGHTVVSVSALDDIHSVVVDVNGVASTLAADLPKGWSASRSVSGTYQSVVVSLNWRGATQRIPIVCQ